MPQSRLGGFLGPFPQVAIYLDEQSVQLAGRNLDLYTVDLDRIEVLEGPQGTLFGAGAEAGVLRYITHRPELDVTEATASTGIATTAHGAPIYSASLVLNLPLIPETLAAARVPLRRASRWLHRQRSGHVSAHQRRCQCQRQRLHGVARQRRRQQCILGGQRHQPGDLYRSALRSTVQIQRRLGRIDRAILSAHGGGQVSRPRRPPTHLAGHCLI